MFIFLTCLPYILFILVLDGCWIDELMHQQWFIMRPHFFAHIEYYLVLQVFSSCHWHTNECKAIFGVWTILFRRTVAWWAKSFLIRRLIKDYKARVNKNYFDKEPQRALACDWSGRALLHLRKFLTRWTFICQCPSHFPVAVTKISLDLINLRNLLV